MAHLPRRRLNSLSDNSTPSSDISEGSETYEASSGHEWQLDSHNSHSLIVDNLDLRLDSLSLDTNSIAEITDHERAQIESFFSGLGTEVSWDVFIVKVASRCRLKSNYNEWLISRWPPNFDTFMNNFPAKSSNLNI